MKYDQMKFVQNFSFNFMKYDLVRNVIFVKIIFEIILCPKQERGGTG